jgi:hypothetical protein
MTSGRSTSRSSCGKARWSPSRSAREHRRGSALRSNSAANLWHVQERLGIPRDEAKVYKVAWVGGCVLYDTEKLRSVGGFNFWRELPPAHVGEDALAEMRVMERFGGAGLIPSGAYHQELPTTLPRREVDAPRVIPLH